MNGKINLKNNKIINLRVISIILVILAHSIIIYNNSWNLYSTNVSNSFFEYLCLFIYIFHMPLFFSISGFLFKSVDIKNRNELIMFFKKKVKRLLIPYFFVGTFWLIPIRYLVGYDNYVNNTLLYNVVINFILGKDNGHLWFLPSLFIIFIIYALCKYYIKSNKKMLFLSFLFSILGYLVPSYFGSALQNIFWFSLGNYISSTQDKTIRHEFALIFTVVVSIILYLIIYNSGIVYSKYFCLALKYFICLILIPLLYYYIPNKTNKLIKMIDRNSFGMYLFHSPLVYITFSSLLIEKPITTFIVNFIIFGFLSFLITLIIRKLNLGYVIGEKRSNFYEQK